MNWFILNGILLILTIFITQSSSLPNIQQDFIPVGNKNRPGTKINPTYITVHNTANTAKGANAKSHANFVKNKNTEVSWHYTVDDRSIYQHLPTNEVGWHAGTRDGNHKSIGIEICENSDGDFEKAVKTSQELIRKLMKDLKIPKDRVVTHKSWSGKDCPRKLLNRWTSYKNGI